MIKRAFIIASICWGASSMICLGQGKVTRQNNTSTESADQTRVPSQETKKRNRQGMSQSMREQVIVHLENNMLLVKGGAFQMGATDLQGSSPVHQVEVDDFYMGKYEVTQREWYAVTGKVNTYKYEENVPVVLFDWEDLEAFIKVLNQKTNKTYRLPTEAEWEWAAQGGNKSGNYKYAGSNEAYEVASSYKPVGTKKPNELGLYDMSGNVGELCSDFYGPYSSDPQINPTGPSMDKVEPSESGYYHVIKGGAWPPVQYAPERMYEYRPQFRDKATGSGNWIGFRLVLDVIPEGIDAKTYVAAKKGQLSAMEEVANHYLQMKDYGLYVKWMERLGVKGDLNAYRQLGKIYREGTLVQKDLLKSENYLAKAFDLGDSSVKSDLGEVMAEIGLSCEKTNTKEALAWFEKGAALGNAECQNNAGLCYWFGKGVGKDYEKAANYFL